MASLQVIKPAVVAQADLEALIGISNQIKHLQRMYNNQANDLLERLMAGDAIEPGIHHAEVVTSRAGGRITTALQVY